jgi:hypothetical protein
MTKSWEFRKLQKNGNRTVEVTVELEAEGLGACADDPYYQGDLTKEESLDLARAVLAKFDPSPLAVGTHARVVDGSMCGCHGVVIGTVREDGRVILRCHDGVLIQPAECVRASFDGREREAHRRDLVGCIALRNQHWDVLRGGRSDDAARRPRHHVASGYRRV